VLSLGILKKILEAFTPEELLYTELITQNMEASSMQSNSGRARNSERLKVKAGQTENVGEKWSEQPGTIACVSGFLLNMPKKTVRMITPVPCTDQWPNGYWVFEEGTFDSAESFGSLLDGMMERHMPLSLRMNDTARFRRDIRYSEIEDGIALQSFGATTHYFGGEPAKTLGRLLSEKNHTVLDIALAMEKVSSAPLEKTLNFLNSLFDHGFLDEEPEYSPWESQSKIEGMESLDLVTQAATHP